jgi:hypothetical protein
VRPGISNADGNRPGRATSCARLLVGQGSRFAPGVRFLGKMKGDGGVVGRDAVSSHLTRVTMSPCGVKVLRCQDWHRGVIGHSVTHTPADARCKGLETPLFVGGYDQGIMSVSKGVPWVARPWHMVKR